LEGRPDIAGAGTGRLPTSPPIDLPQARAVLAAAEKCVRGGDASLRPVAAAIRLEIAIAEAESTAGPDGPIEGLDPLFRLRTKRWAVADGDLAGLVPIRDPQLRMLTFDVSALVDGQVEPRRPAVGTEGPRHVVAFAQVNGERREPLFVSEGTARILELSDGTRTALEIVAELGSGTRNAGGGGLQQIEELFVSGLLWFHEGRIDRIETRPDPIKSP
jgi:hypothetical protein